MMRLRMAMRDSELIWFSNHNCLPRLCKIRSSEVDGNRCGDDDFELDTKISNENAASKIYK